MLYTPGSGSSLSGFLEARKLHKNISFSLYMYQYGVFHYCNSADRGNEFTILPDRTTPRRKPPQRGQ